MPLLWKQKQHFEEAAGIQSDMGKLQAEINMPGTIKKSAVQHAQGMISHPLQFMAVLLV